MNSISVDSSLWVKVGQAFLNLFIYGNRVIVCSESSIVRSDVYLFVQDSAIFFQWSVAALFRFMFVETFTAKLDFIGGDVIATISYYIDTTSPYIWTLLWRDQVLSSHVVCVLHNMFEGRNLLQHQQWNYRHSHLIAISVIPLSLQVLYNLPVFPRQEQDTANLCPFPTLRICLHHKIWWRSWSTAPTIAVLRIEELRTRQWLALCVQSELWRVQLNTMNCSHDLAFWTVYYSWPHVFIRHWGTSLQCVGSDPWSGNRMSCWLEAS